MKSRITSTSLPYKQLLSVWYFARSRSAQDLASFEKRTAVKKLDNGLTVIICERPEAPVFSFFTHVDVGSVQDPWARRAGPHVRAYGVQGNGHDRDARLSRRKSCAGKKLKRLMQPTSLSGTNRWTATAKTETARTKLEGCDSCCRQVLRALQQRVWKNCGDGGRRRSQRLYGLRRDRLSLLVSRSTGWSCGRIWNQSVFCIR